MSKRSFWLSLATLAMGRLLVGCTGGDTQAEFTQVGETSAGTQQSSGSNEGRAGSGTSRAGATGMGGAGSHSGGAGPTSSGGDTQGGHSGTAGSGESAGQAGSGGAQAGSAGDASVGGIANGGSGGTAAGAGGTPGAMPCDTSTDCTSAGQYCLKEGCGETQGLCVNASAQEPVCGCNGVTYYDGTLARAAHVSVKAAGICSDDTALHCEQDKCRAGLTCGRVMPPGALCQAQFSGVCWLLPPQCPEVEMPRASNCFNNACSGFCAAVDSGKLAVAISNPLGCIVD